MKTKLHIIHQTQVTFYYKVTQSHYSLEIKVKRIVESLHPVEVVIK